MEAEAAGATGRIKGSALTFRAAGLLRKVLAQDTGTGFGQDA